MISKTEVKHKIQENILSYLLHQKIARFSDMRPSRIDTNLYSYHLTQLVKNGFVKKVDDGYTLDIAGLIYCDSLGTDRKSTSRQPKIVTMFVIQNSNGDLLLQRRTKQPYIDMWTLPNGKMHINDMTLIEAAKREAVEKINVLDQEMQHVGDSYVRVLCDGEVVTMTLAHIFTFNRDDVETNINTIWARPHKLHAMELAPGVSEIVARTFFRDPFFFEEFDVVLE